MGCAPSLGKASRCKNGQGKPLKSSSRCQKLSQKIKQLQKTSDQIEFKEIELFKIGEVGSECEISKISDANEVKTDNQDRNIIETHMTSDRLNLPNSIRFQFLFN